MSSIEGFPNISFNYQESTPPPFKTTVETLESEIKNSRFDDAIGMLRALPEWYFRDMRYKYTLCIDSVFEAAFQNSKTPCELFTLLHEIGFNFDPYGVHEQPDGLERAVLMKRADVVEVLLPKYSSFHSRLKAFFAAIEHNTPDVMAVLLDSDRRLHDLYDNLGDRFKAIKENKIELATVMFQHWELNYLEDSLPGIFWNLFKALNTSATTLIEAVVSSYKSSISQKTYNDVLRRVADLGTPDMRAFLAAKLQEKVTSN